MLGALGILVLFILVLILIVTLARANEVFCLSYRGGRLLVVRGILPATLRRDVLDILRTLPGREVLLKGYLHDDEPSLVVTGAEEPLAQSLRNAFFVHAPETLAPMTKRPRRAWWQVLGFVWLAWWMQRRDEAPPTNITKFRK